MQTITNLELNIALIEKSHKELLKRMQCNMKKQMPMKEKDMIMKKKEMKKMMKPAKKGKKK